MFDLIIIGGGVAGMSAGIYAARSGLKALIIEKMGLAGQLSEINNIENYPGVMKTDGFTLASEMEKQIKELGVEVQYGEVTSIKIENSIKTVCTKNNEFQAKAVIIANGLERRKLNCKGEKEFFGKGVFYCGICDGFFYRNKTVTVVGGGSSALTEALYLKDICEKVNIIHRRNEFRGEKILVDKINESQNITVYYSSVVKEITGDNIVKEIIIERDGSEETLKTDGVLVSIGYIPQNEIFRDIISLDENGYIIVDSNFETTSKGVFAVGDTIKKDVRQIVTAASDGSVAAVKAAEYIQTL